MKIAVVGKGGSGKTTVAALLARTLARRGLPVIALDCDTNPNLGISLGLGPDRTGALVAIRQEMDAEPEPEHAATAEELLTRFGDRGPDGVRFAVVSKIEQADPG
jgi:CO dehydrogenase maturation factor